MINYRTASIGWKSAVETFLISVGQNGNYYLQKGYVSSLHNKKKNHFQVRRPLMWSDSKKPLPA